MGASAGARIRQGEGGASEGSQQRASVRRINAVKRRERTPYLISRQYDLERTQNICLRREKQGARARWKQQTTAIHQKERGVSRRSCEDEDRPSWAIGVSTKHLISSRQARLVRLTGDSSAKHDTKVTRFALVSAKSRRKSAYRSSCSRPSGTEKTPA